MSDTTNDTPRSILIVDDSDVQRNATSSLFAFRGYEVHQAADEGGTLEILDRDIDLSLAMVDLTLGHPNTGIELIRKIVEYRPGLRIIVYTGQSHKFGGEALRAGAMFYIQKGDPGELVKIADAVAGVWELERELESYRLQGDFMQRIFDAVGVEILVRAPDGKILMVNRTKRRAWERRYGPGTGKDCIDKLSCPDCPGSKMCPSRKPENLEETREYSHGDHTLLLETRKMLDENGVLYGVIEAAVDISRRKLVIEYAHRLETMFGSATKEEIGKEVVEMLHEFTGGRVRFYIYDENRPIGYACAAMEDGISFVGFQLEEQDVQVTEAFRDHGVKILDLNPKKPDGCDEKLRTRGASQKLFIPLIHGVERIGMIVIDNKRDSRRRFTREDCDLIGLFRNSIEEAITIADNRLADERKREWLEALAEVDQELMTAEDGSVVESKIIKIIHRMLGAKNTSLYQYEADLLIETASQGKSPKRHNEPFSPAEGGPILWAISTGETQVVRKDLHSHPKFSAFLKSAPEEWTEYYQNLKSLILAPLKIGKRVVAVCAFRFEEEIRMSRADKIYLEEMLRRISMVMSRIEIYKKIESNAYEAARFTDVALLASGYGHSLKNNIQRVSLEIDVLRKVIGSEEQDRLDRVANSLKRMQMRIKDLSDWVKPAQAGTDSVNLNDLVTSIVRLVEPEAKQDNITVSFSEEKDELWVSDEGGTLRVAVLDLFQNALKFMASEGGGELQLEVSLKGDEACLIIRDTGPGVPSEVIAALNDPDDLFLREGDPFGLGLYLATKVISRMNGSISARNRQSKGAEFEVRIPIQEKIS